MKCKQGSIWIANALHFCYSGDERMVKLLLENVTNTTETASILGGILAHVVNEGNSMSLNGIGPCKRLDAT